MIKNFKPLQVLLITLFVLLCPATHAQNASGNIYKDAITLYNAVQGTMAASDNAVVNEILIYYSNSLAATQPPVNLIITANPFLNANAALQAYAAAIALVPQPSIGEVAVPTSGASGLLGLNVANYADGAARFLIERGKQELSMAFFERMQGQFGNYPELPVLFPETFAIINNIQNHNLLTLLQELRDAYVKDLVRIPQNILSLRNLTAANCPAGRANTACVARIAALTGPAGVFNTNNELVLSLLVMQGLIAGENIISILNSAVTDPQFCATNTGLLGYLKLSAILLDAFRSDKESDGLFINETKLRNLFNSPELLNIFLALAYEKYNTLPCYSGLAIGGMNLQALFTALIAARNNFQSALVSFDNINAAYLGIKEQIKDGTFDKPAYANLVAAAMLKAAQTVKSIRILTGTATLPAPVNNVLVNLEIGSDLCVDIYQRNYPGIFNSVIRIIDRNALITDPQLEEAVVKYMSFASNMAAATNADEIENALEAASLPPGSYSVKQRAGYNIAFNGYIGYAWDFRGGLHAKGIYAPLGFSISKGLGRDNGGALTLFASVFDIGAIASYRLTNGMVDTLKQEVKLESIISPSAQLIFGIPKLPISIAGGWRQTPKLFFEGNKDFAVIGPRNVFNFSILIDIPIFNIWTRPYE
jgi:hypothetical protein